MADPAYRLAQRPSPIRRPRQQGRCRAGWAFVRCQSATRPHLVPEPLRGVVFASPTLIPAARTVMAMVWCLLGTVLNKASRALGSYASYIRGEGCP